MVHYFKAKPPDSGDLYDVIIECGMAYQKLRLTPKLEATDVPMPLHTM